MSIEREAIGIVEADENFCGRRVTGRVVLGGKNDSPGQAKMFETDLQLAGTFDIHRFGVSADSFTTGITFSLKSIDVATLAKFSKGSGRIVFNSVAEILEDQPEEIHDSPGQTQIEDLRADGPWRKVKLEGLFGGAVLKSLHKAGLETVGDLHDFQQPDKKGHIKQLTDITGIGEAKVSQIEERMIEFWKQNPDTERTAAS